MNADSLGDRIKSYEGTFDFILPHQLPLILRLDGRAFHSFTRKMKFSRPVDEIFHQAMVKTTIALCEEISNARFGYTQSDEISILIYPKYFTSDPWFGNRLQKIISASASLASITFIQELLSSPYADRLKELRNLPTFDARIFIVPLHDVNNAFLWRQRDATKNSVSMFAEHHLNRSILEGKHTTERIQMLADIGIDWNTLPAWQRIGTGVAKEFTSSEITEENGSIRTVIRALWTPIELKDFHQDPSQINKFLTTPSAKIDD